MFYVLNAARATIGQVYGSDKQGAEQMRGVIWARFENDKKLGKSEIGCFIIFRSSMPWGVLLNLAPFSMPLARVRALVERGNRYGQAARLQQFKNAVNEGIVV